MEDIMREYEDIALQFYDDPQILQAVEENKKDNPDKENTSLIAENYTR